MRFWNLRTGIGIFLLGATLLVAAAFVLLRADESMRNTTVAPPVETHSTDSAPQLPLSSTVRLDTTSWKTYRNETYAFELRYPNSFDLHNRDLARSAAHSTFIVLNKSVDPGHTPYSVLIEVIPSAGEREVQFHLGMTDSSYIEYIRDPSRHKRADFISIQNRTVPVFFFDNENPGGLGDSRSTLVLLIEHNNFYLVIKKVPAVDLDGEFVGILSSLNFTRY